MRSDGRRFDELRRIDAEIGFLKYAGGSCLLTAGNTRVICAATIEDRVPPFLTGSGTGWLTAEYGLLPCSTQERVQREATSGRLQGRTHEIKRFIGRSLRPIIDLKALGEKTIIIDCDVIQADGGTRTLSVNGAFIALFLLLDKLVKNGELPRIPIIDSVAAVSVGIIDGQPLLDLCYEEDVRAEVDMNIVMTGQGRVVEIQGTAEHNPFTESELFQMFNLAKKGIHEIIALERKLLRW
ncbi:MAG: ribonuclease PH [candidate division WOR-3 bacterium]